jgi:hypothetical protein
VIRLKIKGIEDTIFCFEELDLKEQLEKQGYVLTKKEEPFKVGDTVVCVGAGTSELLRVGEEYEITKVSYEAVKVKYFDKHWFPAKFFKKSEKPEEKPKESLCNKCAIRRTCHCKTDDTVVCSQFTEIKDDEFLRELWELGKAHCSGPDFDRLLDIMIKKREAELKENKNENR